MYQVNKASTIQDIEMAKINHQCQLEVGVKIQSTELLELVHLLTYPMHQVKLILFVHIFMNGINYLYDQIRYIIDLVSNFLFLKDGISAHRPSTPPPMMPEKTKIHLRTNQPQSLNPSLNQRTNQQSNKPRNGINPGLSKAGASDSSSSKNKRVKDVKSQNAKVSFIETSGTLS